MPDWQSSAILRVLFERATSGRWTDASLARPRIGELIAEKNGIPIAAAVLQIYLDELISAGLVTKPERGVRDRYQITPKGISEVDRADVAVESKAWTGSTDRQAMTEEKRVQIVKRIRELRETIESADLTNEQKSQAVAMMTAALTMAEAPEPPWSLIKEALLILASISSVLMVAFETAKLIN
jgi:DNA-binding PadR family transcriptional regulator